MIQHVRMIFLVQEMKHYVFQEMYNCLDADIDHLSQIITDDNETNWLLGLIRSQDVACPKNHSHHNPNHYCNIFFY